MNAEYLQYVLPFIAAIVVGWLSYLGSKDAAKASYDKIVFELKTELEKQQIKSDEQRESIKKDIKRLEEKQDKHNGLIERTFRLEQRVDDIEKQIK